MEALIMHSISKRLEAQKSKSSWVLEASEEVLVAIIKES